MWKGALDPYRSTCYVSDGLQVENNQSIRDNKDYDSAINFLPWILTILPRKKKWITIYQLKADYSKLPAVWS